MFDGINAIYKLSERDTHILNFHLWEVLVIEQTGERANDFKTFFKHGLNFILKPSLSFGYVLSIKGSLHKFHNEGEPNSNRFTFEDVQKSISELCRLFDILPENIELHGLEIGLNISVPYPVKRVLKSMVAYKAKPFTQIHKGNDDIGFICSLSEYSLKIYNKGKQAKTDKENLLRFEVSINKMRYLKGTFATLADLINKKKALTGIEYLKDCYNAIIWTDSTANKNSMSDREVRQWLSYSNPKVWQSMKKDGLKNSRIRWKNLLSKYGKTPDILPLILNEWHTLFKEKEAENLPPFHPFISESEALKLTPFSLFKCNGEKGVYRDLKSIDEKDIFPMEVNNNINKENSFKKSAKKTPEKRACKTCKKDITHQRRQSVFCSSKYVGEKKAKSCRNKKSNQKRDIKKMVQKAIEQNKYLVITYTHEKLTYADILHPLEFEFNNWIDNILKIRLYEKEQ